MQYRLISRVLGVKYCSDLAECMFCLCVIVPDDWDLVKTLADVRKMSPTHSLLTTSNMIIGSLSKTVSTVTKAMGLYECFLLGHESSVGIRDLHSNGDNSSTTDGNNCCSNTTVMGTVVAVIPW